jgi:hypothetical protein
VNDIVETLLHFFADTATSTSSKATLAALGVLAVCVLALLLSNALQMSFAPRQKVKSRREWRALAAKSGWASEYTRQLSGKRGANAWRMAVLRTGEGFFDRSRRQPNQAIWQMRKLNHGDRLFIVPQGEYQARKRTETVDTTDSDQLDLKHFAGALAGLATRETWAGAAVGWSVAGDQHADWVNEDLPTIHVGSEWFQARYVVLADRAALAVDMINEKSEALLSKVLTDASIKPDQFMAVLVEGQFSMRCVGNLTQASVAGRFCQLGLALTARLS